MQKGGECRGLCVGSAKRRGHSAQDSSKPIHFCCGEEEQEEEEDQPAFLLVDCMNRKGPVDKAEVVT